MILSKHHKEIAPRNPVNTQAMVYNCNENIIKLFDIPAVIVRCGIVYGPDQHPDQLIPQLIIKLLVNDHETIYNSSDSAYNFIYIDDVVDRIDMIMHYGQHTCLFDIYNLTGTHTIKDVVKCILDKVNSNRKVTYENIFSNIKRVHYKINDVDNIYANYHVSSLYIQFASDSMHETPLQEGIEKTIKWLKSSNMISGKYVLR